MTKRAVLIVLDSVGIGELPDADKFGDSGSNTLANTAKAVGGLHLPVMGQMGLGNIASIQGVPAAEKPTAAYGKMAELSQGKDTVTGHWEIAGVLLKDPLRTFPHGFPAELIEAYERAIGRKTLGNEVASGTEIIARLGGEHMRTGYPIVYTSADSVFQIAAHEEVIPIELLYEFCEKARAMLTGPWAVGRVIARPFVGEPGHFTRTERRKDYALKPPVPTALNHLAEAGVYVAAVGKIEDIYSGEGISEAVHTKSNQHGIDVTLEFMRKLDAGLIFTNLVDFDMLYGHRNDPAGYAKALEEVDGRLPEIMHLLREDDVLIITADHGCDPTTESTDHSREYVPLLVYGKKVRPVSLGVRQTFADVGATLCDLFRAKPLPLGTSMCQELGLI